MAGLSNTSETKETKRGTKLMPMTENTSKGSQGFASTITIKCLLLCKRHYLWSQRWNFRIFDHIRQRRSKLNLHSWGRLSSACSFSSSHCLGSRNGTGGPLPSLWDSVTSPWPWVSYAYAQTTSEFSSTHFLLLNSLTFFFELCIFLSIGETGFNAVACNNSATVELDDVDGELASDGAVVLNGLIGLGTPISSSSTTGETGGLVRAIMRNIYTGQINPWVQDGLLQKHSSQRMRLHELVAKANHSSV